MRGVVLGVKPLSQGCISPQVLLDFIIIINCIIYLLLDPHELLWVRSHTHGATQEARASRELPVLQESCSLVSPLTSSAAWGNVCG